MSLLASFILQIHENIVIDPLACSCLTQSLSVLSEAETVPRQIVVEDVEESISEEGVKSDLLPNTVRKAMFNGSLCSGLTLIEQRNTAQYIVHRVINIVERYFPLQASWLWSRVCVLQGRKQQR